MALKKFCFVWPLELGAKLYLVFMIVIKLVCIIGIVLQIIEFTNCTSYCSKFVLCSTYAFSATGFLFCIIMIFVHIWFYFMGIMQKKASVVMTWVVVTTIWMMEAFILTITLVCIYMEFISLTAFIIYIVFTLIGFGISIYGICIGYGLYKKIKDAKTNDGAGV